MRVPRRRRADAVGVALGRSFRNCFGDFESHSLGDGFCHLFRCGVNDSVDYCLVCAVRNRFCDRIGNIVGLRDDVQDLARDTFSACVCYRLLRQRRPSARYAVRPRLPAQHRVDGDLGRGRVRSVYNCAKRDCVRPGI